MQTNGRCEVIQYRDKDLLWWWEVKNKQGRVIGRSLRGFTRRVNCSSNMHKVSWAMTPPIAWAK